LRPASLRILVYRQKSATGPELVLGKGDLYLQSPMLILFRFQAQSGMSRRCCFGMNSSLQVRTFHPEQIAAI